MQSRLFLLLLFSVLESDCLKALFSLKSTVKKALEFNFDKGYQQCIPSILKIPFLGFFQDICKLLH